MQKFIPVSQPSITELEIAYVTDAVRSGWVSSQGDYIQRFEQDFATYCGTEYALATSNGTTALHLALVTYGIGPGDEVIVPDFTFVATANAVSYVGAKAVFVDIDPDTLCIDPHQVERAITPNTKAIIPVHMYGHPADMAALTELADTYNLIIIEDAAEAHGAEFQGRRTGSLGHCGTFSFYGNKLMTCGEGGMITTNDAAFYQRARHLRDHAMSPTKRYWHDEVGYNYRMTNLQAALGLAQLQRAHKLLSRKQSIFERYARQLAHIPGVRLNITRPEVKSSYWMVCFEVEGYTERQRDELLAFLKERGVDSRPYFFPLSDMPMYANMATLTPVTHQIAQRGINVPSYVDMADEDIDYVCEVLLEYFVPALKLVSPAVSRKASQPILLAG